MGDVLMEEKKKEKEIKGEQVEEEEKDASEEADDGKVDIAVHEQEEHTDALDLASLRHEIENQIWEERKLAEVEENAKAKERQRLKREAVVRWATELVLSR